MVLLPYWSSSRTCHKRWEASWDTCQRRVAHWQGLCAPAPGHRRWMSGSWWCRGRTAADCCWLVCAAWKCSEPRWGPTGPLQRKDGDRGDEQRVEVREEQWWGKSRKGERQRKVNKNKERKNEQQKKSCQNHSDIFVGVLRPSVNGWKTDYSQRCHMCWKEFQNRQKSEQKRRTFLLLLNEFVGTGVNDCSKNLNFVSVFWSLNIIYAA